MLNKIKLASILAAALVATCAIQTDGYAKTPTLEQEKHNYDLWMEDLSKADSTTDVPILQKIAKDIIRANPSKLTDNPADTPRYIKPIVLTNQADVGSASYGEYGLIMVADNILTTSKGMDSNWSTTKEAVPELFVYNASVASVLAHEMGHWYRNSDDNETTTEEEDGANLLDLEFTEPLEYGSYAGQWIYTRFTDDTEGHRPVNEEKQRVLDYITTASKGHIKFEQKFVGTFTGFSFDGYSWDGRFFKLPEDSPMWQGFVPKTYGFYAYCNIRDDAHMAYVAAQMAFAIKNGVFDGNHIHTMSAWDFWHSGEAVTAENSDRYNCLTKWTVFYFDNPLSGGRKIIDIYPYTTEELYNKAVEYDNLIRTAPTDDTYSLWYRDNREAIQSNFAYSYWFVCNSIASYNA